MSGQKDKEILASRHLEASRTEYHVLMSGGQYVVVRHSQAWRPSTDVMEDDGRLVVLVEVAGMRDGEFTVTVSGQQLAITGTRPSRITHCSAYHQMEVRYGEFSTEITLPWPVDEEAITALYEDGFLRVELPRAQPEKVRVIEVHKPEE